MSERQRGAQGTGVQDRSDTSFFGQPGVLANLFGVEPWERFSFYGMQGILLIYLCHSAAEGGLGTDEAVATGIVGAYGGAVRLDGDLFGWEMPISWVNSINLVFVIVLAGAFAALWTKLGHRQPVTPIKFGAGTALMGVAFFSVLLMPPGENTVPLLGLAGVLLLSAVAELLISPVGLSATTKLGPRTYTTQMVALYFLSIALGTALAGTLVGYYDATDEAPFFVSIGLASVVTGVLVMLASKPIHRLMAGVD